MRFLLITLIALFLGACMQTPPLPEDHIYNKQGDNSPYAIKKPSPKKKTDEAQKKKK